MGRHSPARWRTSEAEGGDACPLFANKQSSTDVLAWLQAARLHVGAENGENKWRWPEQDGALVAGDGSRAEPGGHGGRRSIAGFPGGNLVKRDRIQRLEEQEIQEKEKGHEAGDLLLRRRRPGG